ncbi:hypothetical protein KIL84_021595 [Mauremys mutica]|uniref:Uncharacterized protein n=1 Tax=Mauremys mutica TaxID=74926 RepID=A0A9D3X908_9SAUR|nr:hypothetical protein KIL84_021595 [Mauremys mutica]
MCLAVFPASCFRCLGRDTLSQCTHSATFTLRARRGRTDFRPPFYMIIVGKKSRTKSYKTPDKENKRAGLTQTPLDSKKPSLSKSSALTPRLRSEISDYKHI